MPNEGPSTAGQGGAHFPEGGSVNDFPRGKAQPGEPLDEAAAHELEKETHLLVDPDDFELVPVIHVELGWDQTGQFVLFVFATDKWTGELTNTEPNKRLTARWVLSDHFPEPAFHPRPHRRSPATTMWSRLLSLRLGVGCGITRQGSVEDFSTGRPSPTCARATAPTPANRTLRPTVRVLPARGRSRWSPLR
ncbi:NUDIX domain-containing protein [Kitasatospora sp. NPDC088160]|uniref:NUDIX domain-containing protein n=1 Tax=Kitasatospora sp. NPDC088160 TaxID=3364072 RepID=UPI0037F50C8D